MREEKPAISGRISGADYMRWRLETLEGIIYFLDLGPDATSEQERLIAKTLLRLPKTLREKVLSEVCFVALGNELSGAMCWKSWQPRWRDKPQPVIYLNFSQMHPFSERKRMRAIAHEIAHYALSRNDPILALSEKEKSARNIESARRRNIERQADSLCRKWGFTGVYSRKRLEFLDQSILARPKRALSNLRDTFPTVKCRDTGFSSGSMGRNTV